MSGRASSPAACTSDAAWTGYYLGETLRAVRGPDGWPGHLDLGSSVFTRQPYERGAPLAARPDPDGWRADTSDV